MKNFTQATVHRSYNNNHLFCVIIASLEKGYHFNKVALKDVDFETASEFCVQYNKAHNPEVTQETS